MFKYIYLVKCPIYNNNQKVYYGILPNKKCLSNGCDNMSGCQVCIECISKVQEEINKRLASQSELL